MQLRELLIFFTHLCFFRHTSRWQIYIVISKFISLIFFSIFCWPFKSLYFVVHLSFCARHYKKILSAYLSSPSYVLYFSCRNLFCLCRGSGGACVCVRRVSCTLACLSQWHIITHSSMKECFTEIFHSSVTFYRQSLQYYSENDDDDFKTFDKVSPKV